jgi:hypothetical protein
MDTTITLMGRQHPIRVPPSFAAREELVMAWTTAGNEIAPLRRVYAAAVALCTRALAPRPNDKTRLPVYTGDVLTYGAAAYDLYAAGTADMATADRITELFTAGQSVLVVVAESLAPRESEVRDRAGFSNPAAESSTPPASGSA